MDKANFGKRPKHKYFNYNNRAEYINAMEITKRLYASRIYV